MVFAEGLERLGSVEAVSDCAVVDMLEEAGESEAGDRVEYGAERLEAESLSRPGPGAT